MTSSAKARLAAAVISVLGFLVAATGEVQARPAVCAKLERQLASAGSGGGNARFQNAARQQAQQLQIARSQARSAGCGGSFFFAGSNSGQCAKLNGTIRKMQANLARLQNKANAGGSGDMSKTRIRAALDANDCYGQPIDANAKRTLPAPVKPAQRSLFSQLFGGSVKQAEPVEVAVKSLQESSVRRVRVMNGNEDSGYMGGTYRTICVRTCDGYYFPVSFSTTQSHFADDEKACASMCPGAETKLYTHRVPEEEPEQMISLAKEPYTSMPTAFKYRLDGAGSTPGCTCQAAIPEATADDANGAVATRKVKWVPEPSLRPSLLDDPETAANRISGLDGDAIAYLIEGRQAPAASVKGRKVRVVGPEFLPAQTKAEELPFPGRVTVQ